MPRSSATATSQTSTWAVIAAGAGVLGVGSALSGVWLTLGSAGSICGVNLALAALARLLRRAGWERVADYLTATIQLALATACFTGVSYVLEVWSLPLQDSRLAAADRALGLDWRTLTLMLMRLPWLMAVLNYAYASLGYQMALVVPLLFLRRGPDGARFVFAWVLALAATVVISPLVPALGGFLHNGIAQADVPLVRIAAAWRFRDSFELVRTGRLQQLDLADLDGIVTFPSFHAASAVLLAWGCRHVLGLRETMLVLNGLMWMSSVPIGGHYGVDVLAGSAVALASILVVKISTARRIEASRPPAEPRPALTS